MAANQIFSLEVDKDMLKKLLDRFDKAPDKIQKNATGVTLTAGAKEVMKEARAKAPSCLRNTIKLKNRKTIKRWIKKVSVVAGTGDRAREGLNRSEISSVRKAGGKAIDCTPAIWVEFGTYGKRDYKGEHPYSPATLRKKSYASGRSNSPYWHKGKNLWISPKPFLAPALKTKKVEKAMAARLNVYLTKKGF